MLSKRMALLTTEIPPYRHALFSALQERFGEFRVFVSYPEELHRPPPGWTVNVTFQRTLLINSMVYRHLRPASRLVMWATVSEENERGRGRWRERLRQWLLPQVDAIIVNGQSGARCVRGFGVREHRIVTIPQTTDLDSFAAVNLRRDQAEARRLLYVGQLINRKGLMPFVGVLKHWAMLHPASAVEFWLAGEGDLRPTIETLTLPSNLTLRWLGHIEYRDLPAVYAQAGIFVFPSLADEWALVVNEALAAGLPVLGSVYSQAADELTSEGVNGWRFRPDDAAEMISALDRALATSLADLECMRIAARQRVRGLTPDYVADRMVDVVRHVS